jgi:phage recombination protein Bet
MLAIPAIQDMATAYRMNVEAFALTFRAVAMPKPHSEPEFVACCLVAQQHGLNPLTKEIYFMRDKHGNIQAIVGVDGWIKKCNEHPQFDGIEFEDIPGEDGKLSAIKCRIFRKDRTRTTETTEYMVECLQKRDKVGPWQTHPNRMLRHRSLIQCSRIAFGFAGIMDRDEFDQWQQTDAGTAPRDITPAPASDPMSQDVPEMPDPVAASDDVPEMPDPESQVAPTIDVAAFLIQFREELAAAKKNKAARLAVWEKYAETIGELSEEDADLAEKILEGRAK